MTVSVRCSRSAGRTAVAVLASLLLVCVLTAVAAPAADAVPSGRLLWKRSFNGPLPAGPDFGGVIALGPGGVVCVASQSTRAHGGGANPDIAVVKYTSAGRLCWVRTYNGSGNAVDTPTRIAVDRFGNVLVTGSSRGASSGLDIVTIKYDWSGHRKWVRRFDGAVHGDDSPADMAVDRAGNVYVTGSTPTQHQGLDWATIKYAAAGQARWKRYFNSPSDASDWPTSIAVDGAGNAYVAGMGLFDTPLRPYTVIAAYPATGHATWWAGWSSSVVADDFVNDVAVGKGSVYLVGSTTPSGGTSDALVLRYTTDGLFQWAATYDQAGDNDQLIAAKVDTKGNLVAAGDCVSAATADDFLVLKFRPDSSRAWEQVYGYPGNGNDAARALSLDGHNNVFVVGDSSHLSYDYAAISYNAAGVFRWLRRYDGPAHGMDAPAGIAVRTDVGVYVSGFSDGSPSHGWEVTTIAYRP